MKICHSFSNKLENNRSNKERESRNLNSLAISFVVRLDGKSRGVEGFSSKLFFNAFVGLVGRMHHGGKGVHENEQSVTRSNELKLEGADQKAIAKIVKKKERG